MKTSEAERKTGINPLESEVDLASSMYRGGKLYIDDKHNKTTAESAIANFRAAAEKICNTGLSEDDVYALQMCSTQNF